MLYSRPFIRELVSKTKEIVFFEAKGSALEEANGNTLPEAIRSTLWEAKGSTLWEAKGNTFSVGQWEYLLGIQTGPGPGREAKWSTRSTP